MGTVFLRFFHHCLTLTGSQPVTSYQRPRQVHFLTQGVRLTRISTYVDISIPPKRIPCCPKRQWWQVRCSKHWFYRCLAPAQKAPRSTRALGVFPTPVTSRGRSQLLGHKSQLWCGSELVPPDSAALTTHSLWDRGHNCSPDRCNSRLPMRSANRSSPH